MSHRAVVNRSSDPISSFPSIMVYQPELLRPPAPRNVKTMLNFCENTMEDQPWKYGMLIWTQYSRVLSHIIF